jgi:hypothetical protein
VQNRRSTLYRERDPRTADVPVLLGMSTPRSSTWTGGVTGQGAGNLIDFLARKNKKWLSCGRFFSFSLSRSEGDDKVPFNYRTNRVAPPASWLSCCDYQVRLFQSDLPPVVLLLYQGLTRQRLQKIVKSIKYPLDTALST